MSPASARRHAALTPFACACLLFACRNPVVGEDADPRTCPQTYEFGNTGCYELEGQIVGVLGQPLRGISVVVRPIPASRVFIGGYAMTDTSGRFRIRSSRMDNAPSPSMEPDTVSTYVVASDPASAGVGIPATIRDSVRTVVTIAPVGQIPNPVSVRITLAATR